MNQTDYDIAFEDVKQKLINAGWKSPAEVVEIRAEGYDAGHDAGYSYGYDNGYDSGCNAGRGDNL